MTNMVYGQLRGDRNLVKMLSMLVEVCSAKSMVMVHPICNFMCLSFVDGTMV